MWQTSFDAPQDWMRPKAKSFRESRLFIASASEMGNFGCLGYLAAKILRRNWAADNDESLVGVIGHAATKMPRELAPWRFSVCK
jgi:hypothetical protein